MKKFATGFLNLITSDYVTGILLGLILADLQDRLF